MGLNMAGLFIDIEDIRGIRVTCSKNRFNKLLEKHPEDIETLQIVDNLIKTLQQPTAGLVYASNYQADRLVYYRRRSMARDFQVVADFSGKYGEDMITTYHISSNRPKQEVLVWPVDQRK
jgi:hypothetical protein